MKAVLVAAVALLHLAGHATAMRTVSRLNDFDKKLKEKIEKFRHLQVVNGQFTAMEPKDDNEAKLFKRLEDLAVQRESSFAMDADNFQGNDLVSEKRYRVGHGSHPYINRNNQFDKVEDPLEQAADPKDVEDAAKMENSEEEGHSEEHSDEDSEEDSRAEQHHDVNPQVTDETPAEPEPEPPVVELSEDEKRKQAIIKNITDFHLHTILCMDNHERAPTFHALAFQEICDDCLGTRKRLLRSFYNDIEFQIKDFLFDGVKEVMRVGVCEKSFVDCIEFYRAIQLTAEMGLGMVATMRANGEAIANVIGEDKLNFLYLKTLSLMRDYEEIHRTLAQEKTKLVEVLAGKAENHHTYSTFKPEEVIPYDKPPEPELEDFDEAGAQLPGHNPHKEPKRHDGSGYSEDLLFATKHLEKKKEKAKPAKAAYDESEFFSQPKVFLPKGKKPVNFPESSEALDAMHLKAHELMKFQLKEQAALPLTSNVFRKK